MTMSSMLRIEADVVRRELPDHGGEVGALGVRVEDPHLPVGREGRRDHAEADRADGVGRTQGVGADEQDFLH
jgi:hypothetical protein